MTDTTHEMTYDERVDALARVLIDIDGISVTSEDAFEVIKLRARRLLTAIGMEAPKPTFPTDAMIHGAATSYSLAGPFSQDCWRAALEAAWHADPRRRIVEAAIELRDFHGDIGRERDVINAVNEVYP